MRITSCRAGSAGLMAAFAVLLAGCAPAVTVPAAPAASSPECARVVLALPEQLKGEDQQLERRRVGTQATAAWGEPTAVTLRCGMPQAAPSTNKCISMGPVDWLTVSESKGSWVFISFGRKPATEVVVNTNAISASNALEAVSEAVASTEKTGACL